jgi:3-oxosteroid 1-dehydrogenase
MMVTRPEAARLMRIGRNLDSLWLGARLVSRYALDRLRYRRGTRLVLGNALSARLFRNLLDRHVPVWLNGRTTRIVMEEGKACGVVVDRGGSELVVRARRGVILAGGGFPASAELRQRYFPAPVASQTSAFSGCVGDTLSLAQAIGAALGPLGLDNALWFPSSTATRRDGSTAVYPHIVLDRGKPGLVAVNAAGRRFVNEAVSYHDFTRAMYRAHQASPAIPAWLVCDRRFVWKYGLGMIRPLTPSLRGWVRRGYLRVAGTIDGLAKAIGVDPAGLEETIRLNNQFARSGTDAQFGKGENAFDRGVGDASHRPNPCLGPIGKPPFCAVPVFPTPLGTSLGLRTDAQARVLDESGSQIPGLFACGSDMHSAFGGEYPGAGGELGKGMTFGYLAARFAAAGELRPD